MSHALLSASGSQKWLTCTPSAKLESAFPDEQTDAAGEGTFAHAVFANELLAYLGRPIVELPQDLAKWDSAELRDAVSVAAAQAIDMMKDAQERCNDPEVLVEQRVDFSQWVPSGFGTTDLTIIADDLLDVGDYKHGKGVPVFAKDNTQMRLYALGAYAQAAHLYDIKRVRMTILQPRLNNFSQWEITVTELLQWADEVVVPAAQLAWDGVGEFRAGDHCAKAFCKARFNCKARAEANLELAKLDFMPPELLSDNDIGAVLAKADQISKWASDIQAWALKRAESGARIPGWKLVAGRSVRKYGDSAAVAAKLKANGFTDSDIYTKDLLTITAMEKLVGKTKFNELLGDLLVQSSAKPALVPESDKRAALQSAASAAEDFSSEPAQP